MDIGLFHYHVYSCFVTELMKSYFSNNIAIVKFPFTVDLTFKPFFSVHYFQVFIYEKRALKTLFSRVPKVKEKTVTIVSFGLQEYTQLKMRVNKARRLLSITNKKNLPPAHLKTYLLKALVTLQKT